MYTHILLVTLLRSNTYFDAIIALKIGNRLAIIKIVKKLSMCLCCLIFSYIYIACSRKGAQWLSGRVIDSRPRGRGFELHCFVVLEQDRIILA